MRPPFEAVRPLILASSSPRRQAFLRDQGLDFQILLPCLPEPSPLQGEAPEAYALRAAEAKAEEVLAAYDGQGSPLIIAADTIVVLPHRPEDGAEDGTGSTGATILGKPASEEDAVRMLARLSGRTHTVVTACRLLPGDGEPQSFADTARVTFARWPEDVLRAYAATGEPLDKAGGYAVQGRGAFLVEKIEGSWSTVVGLPMSRLMQELLRMGAVRPFTS